jgi:hypothetical protein
MDIIFVSQNVKQMYNETMTQSKNNRELHADIKRVLLADTDLAGKIINALGGEINLPAFTQMVYRNSARLLKKNILKIIAGHLKLSTDELLSDANLQNENQ